MRKKWINIGFGLGVAGLIFSMFGIGKAVEVPSTSLKAKQEAFETSESEYTSDPNLFSSESEADLTFHIPTVTKTENSTAFKIYINEESSSTNNYMLGYFGTGDQYYPCSVQYTLKNKNGGFSRIGTSAINFSNNLVKYVGVGNDLGPKEDIELTCDLEYGVDEEVDYTQPIYMINIFKYDNPGYEVIDKVPDFTKRYKLQGTVGESFNDIADYCDFDYQGVSIFNGFSSFKVLVNSEKAVESYKNHPTYGKQYRKYEEYIDEGQMYVRTRFSYSGDTSYIIEFKDGRKQEVKDLATNVEIKNNESSLYFLIKNVNYKEVKNLRIKGGLIYVGIYNTETYKEVSKTGFSMRFGYMNFKIDDMTNKDGSVSIAKQSKFYTFDCDLFVGLSVGVFAVCYIAASLVTYFVLKKKYENDEFRRMNTKQYFKNNILGLLCIGSVISFIEFCIVRFGILNNSLPVYNPSDVWVILFGVASILLVGYFIRYFYLLIKARRERIRNEKLKLRLDKQDDGTISVNK